MKKYFPTFGEFLTENLGYNPGWTGMNESASLNSFFSNLKINDFNAPESESTLSIIGQKFIDVVKATYPKLEVLSALDTKYVEYEMSAVFTITKGNSQIGVYIPSTEGVPQKIKPLIGNTIKLADYPIVVKMGGDASTGVRFPLTTFKNALLISGADGDPKGKLWKSNLTKLLSNLNDIDVIGSDAPYIV